MTTWHITLSMTPLGVSWTSWYSLKYKFYCFRNAYVGLDDDITWFGQKSIDPATLALKEAGQQKLFIVIILQIILSQATRRMPSTLWRTPCGTTSDSPSLTTGGWGLSSMTATPVQSQHPRESELKTKYSVCEVIITFSNGVELAKALNNEGASVFGWDMEWNMNYNINRL